MMLLGSIIALISTLGLIRFKDVYTRSHAATKSSTLGVLLTLSGVFVYFWINNHYFSVRVLLGIIFIFLTSPVAGHLTTRAAYHSKVEMYTKENKNELNR